MQSLIKDIAFSSPSKIVLLIIDGLGGLPRPDTGKTELETARTPNLDRLLEGGACGLSDPVAPGITPGSAPGHLGLFGYDPVSCNIGRGILEAIGIDFEVGRDDVAARGNFCTVDASGKVTDRRAGRISTEKNAAISRELDGREIDGVKIYIRPVREHRFVAVFRGKGLSAEVTDSDPQQLSVPPKNITALNPEANRTADIANRFIAQAGKALGKHHPANMLLLRGFSKHPDLPGMQDIYKLKPAAIASYPMYRGLAKLSGMEVLEAGQTIEEEFAVLKQNYANYDFFFVHIKGGDSAGEDGDFARKVRVIEDTDRAIPGLAALKPDVIIVTGDHSTPALLKGHSWHPVPVLLYSKWCRRETAAKFGETACASGQLGRFPASQIMSLAMAHALKLDKFGA